MWLDWTSNVLFPYIALCLLHAFGKCVWRDRWRLRYLARPVGHTDAQNVETSRRLSRLHASILSARTLRFLLVFAQKWEREFLQTQYIVLCSLDSTARTIYRFITPYIRVRHMVEGSIIPEQGNDVTLAARDDVGSHDDLVSPTDEVHEARAAVPLDPCEPTICPSTANNVASSASRSDYNDQVDIIDRENRRPDAMKINASPMTYLDYLELAIGMFSLPQTPTNITFESYECRSLNTDRRQCALTSVPRQVNPVRPDAGYDESWLRDTNVFVTLKAEQRKRQTPKKKASKYRRLPIYMPGQDQAAIEYPTVPDDTTSSPDQMSSECPTVRDDTTSSLDQVPFECPTVRDDTTSSLDQVPWECPTVCDDTTSHIKTCESVMKVTKAQTPSRVAPSVLTEIAVQAPAKKKRKRKKVATSVPKDHLPTDTEINQIAATNKSQIKSNSIDHIANRIVCEELDIAKKETHHKPSTASCPRLPLPKSYYCLMCCNNCLQAAGDVERFHVKLSHNQCTMDVLVVQKGGERVWTKISDRPYHNMPNYVSYKLCIEVKEGRTCTRSKPCWFAHSPAEQALWELDRNDKKEFTIAGFKNDLAAYQSAAANNYRFARLASTEDVAKGPAMPSLPIPGDHDSKLGCVCCFFPSEEAETFKYLGMKHTCPKDILFVRRNGASLWFEIRDRKRHFLSPGVRYAVCVYVRNNQRCGRSGPCWYAHSKIEQQLWTQDKDDQVDFKISKYKAELLRYVISESGSDAAKSERRRKSSTASCPEQRTLDDLTDARSKEQSPSPFHSGQDYCRFCRVQCNSPRQLEHHCLSAQHMANLNSDKDRQWNHRPPPPQFTFIQTCEAHDSGRVCPFSNAPSMHNYCPYAHSEEEKDEWTRRLQYRKTRKKTAESEGINSYVDNLLVEYNKAQTGADVMVEEEMDWITELHCSHKLIVFQKEKTSDHTWTFQIEYEDSDKSLEKVSLIQHQDRSHFRILHCGEEDQVADGEPFKRSKVNDDCQCYEVSIHFSGKMFGSFVQWVAFDFGERPILVKKLRVDVGENFKLDQKKTSKSAYTFDRWSSDKMRITPYPDRLPGADSGFYGELEKTYPPPTVGESRSLSSITDLNENNYVHCMHMFLQMEEIACCNALDKLNQTVTVEVKKTIQEENLFVNSLPGEMFARIPLSQNINDDTDTGWLMRRSVCSVLLRPVDHPTNDVYEAAIVTKATFDYNGLGSDYCYVSLSEQCTQDLHLTPSCFLDVEVQFLINRESFCRMHYALDCVDQTLVMPDVPTGNQPKCTWKVQQRKSSKQMNQQQLALVQHVVQDRQGYVPPLIVYGPFGTGKTETLAQSTVQLMKVKKDKTRVLICTHTNSAADIYITKHFNQEEDKTFKVLRVYQQNRNTNTIPVEVQLYCLLKNGVLQSPSTKDIMAHHIIVTTFSTAVNLLRHKELKGAFTHIFLDEAAQATEAEVLIPVALATRKTCIVLAGDHKQMHLKVFSDETKNWLKHRSLLERLYYHYSNHSRTRGTTNPCVIMLGVNYRTKEGILRFIASAFYDGPEKLKSMCSIPDSPNVKPLAFYATYGEENLDPESRTYYNVAEANEIATRVVELYENWPQEWGTPKIETIGVVTPYSAQVKMIRKALRQKHMSDVGVETTANVQGKEYRALFVSTVRTRHLIRESTRLAQSDMDYAFLSDPHLLNATLTRTEAFVGVVGDPVALCSVGSCSMIWKQFLLECDKLSSIKPQGVTADMIFYGIENYVNYTVLPSVQNNTPATPTNSTHEMHTTITEVDWNLDDLAIEPDEILMQLEKQVKSMTKGNTSVCLKESSRVVETDQSYAMDTFSVECVQVSQQHARAILNYKPPMSSSNSKRKPIHNHIYIATKLPQNNNQTSDGAFGGYECEPDDDSEILKLEKLLERDPLRYKRCRIRIEGPSRITAKVLDINSAVKIIRISNRSRCGRSFHNDEVLVEILSNDEDDKPSADETIQPSGNVVGVLKANKIMRNRRFVSTVHELDRERGYGRLYPIDRNAPVFLNHQYDIKPGAVSVYLYSKRERLCWDKKVEYVDAIAPNNKLFVVRFLKWSPGHVRPLGLVVDCIRPGKSIKASMKILDLEYFIPRTFMSKTQEEVKKKLWNSASSISEHDIGSRKDFTNQLVFTIDPRNSDDLDDALSVEKVAGGYLVGIHISDVSCFIEKGCAIDEEARIRGTTYYPCGETPIHMLPEVLSTGCCSLKPDVCRPTISVLLNIDNNFQIMKKRILRSLIKSKHRLTYTEADVLLDTNSTNDTRGQDLREAVILLHKIALRWRELRLGNESLYVRLRNDDKQSPKSHMLVEEMMVTANGVVAKILQEHQATGQLVPLRVQATPIESAKQSWKDTFCDVARCTVALTQPFLPDDELCRCKRPCTCTQNDQQNDEVDDNYKYFVLQKNKWQAIQKAIGIGRFGKAISLATNIEISPTAVAASANWRTIQEKSMYSLSSELPPNQNKHYSLHVSPYTHFTSPIRRYVDIVVHRLVVGLLTNQPRVQYTADELSEICSQSTEAVQRANKYENATALLRRCVQISTEPIVTRSIAESVGGSNLQLRCPDIEEMQPSYSRISMSLLRPASQPELEGTARVTVKWKERVYNVDPRSPPLPRPPNMTPNFIINPYEFTVHVNTEKWREFLFATVRGHPDDISAAWNDAEMHTHDCSLPAVDVTSERETDYTSQANNLSVQYIGQLCDISMVISPGTYFIVQVKTKVHRGLLQPCLQLLRLTPTLDICLEHRSGPVLCFTGSPVSQASKGKYTDVYRYRSLWMDVVAAEAAHTAVTTGEKMIIHNADIKWNRTGLGEHGVSGEIKLTETFCDERNLKFPRTAKEFDYWYRDRADIPIDVIEQEEEEMNRDICELHFDYFCVRYPVADGNKIYRQPVTKSDGKKAAVATYHKKWICHCISDGISKYPKLWAVTNDGGPDVDMFVYISLQVHQKAMAFPSELLEDTNCENDMSKACVEYIVKGLPHRREEAALFNLPKASMLAKNIATGDSVETLPVSKVSRNMLAVANIKYMPLPGMKPPNESQRQAIDQALTARFSLIQGPSGTGKTATGARLVYLFNHINLQPVSSRHRHQVMYCGPSNKAVDVVIKDYILKCKELLPNVVRVYSEIIEHREFPLPLDDVQMESRLTKEYVVDEDMKKFALHRLIRDPNECPNALKVQKCDMLIDNCKRTGKALTKEQKKDYKDTIKWAKISVLKKKRIVFCTCHSSYGPVVTRGTTIAQLIIDECGMCTEPQSMVPIISTKPDQIVLIGDHKQLKPIVVDERAKRLGLEKSLFQRYKETSHMLNIQYRMHRAIQEFPSRQFYDNKLQCGNPAIQYRPSELIGFWPADQENPIVFVHTVGEEESLAVSTTDGNEQSKSNATEVTKALEVVWRLITTHKIKPNNVLVLSQYRAQCAQLAETFKANALLKDVTVSTVVAAQGSECDYVIISLVRTMPRCEVEQKPSESWKRMNLGFITDQNQINVALTRAKKGLIIIGNRNLLKVDDMWRALLEHYARLGKVVEARDFPRCLTP